LQILSVNPLTASTEFPANRKNSSKLSFEDI
jgi:hypothetical protein